MKMLIIINENILHKIFLWDLFERLILLRILLKLFFINKKKKTGRLEAYAHQQVMTTTKNNIGVSLSHVAQTYKFVILLCSGKCDKNGKLHFLFFSFFTLPFNNVHARIQIVQQCLSYFLFYSYVNDSGTIRLFINNIMEEDKIAPGNFFFTTIFFIFIITHFRHENKRQTESSWKICWGERKWGGFCWKFIDFFKGLEWNP